MSPTERKVRVRRLKRKLKAVASIGLALAAGAFLACTRQPEPIRNEPAPEPDAGPAPRPSVSSPAPEAPDAGADAAPDASADAAPGPGALRKAPDAGIVVRKDAGIVDHNEHRKGMPVPDNLLE